MFKRRIVLFSVSFISLLIGLMIYVFFRSDTYIHDFLYPFLKPNILILQNSLLFNFIRYYFIDFLWGVALSFALLSVSYSINSKSIVLSAILSLLCGIAFEVFQFTGILNGTFDFFDICMYATASIFFAVININIIKKE